MKSIWVESKPLQSTVASTLYVIYIQYEIGTPLAGPAQTDFTAESDYSEIKDTFRNIQAAQFSAPFMGIHNTDIDATSHEGHFYFLNFMKT